MSIKTIIIDDEQSWIDTLSTYVRLHPSLNLEATFTDVFEAYDYIQKHPDTLDLILLDVSMAQLSGIEFARLLKTKPPYIVLCTSSPDYGPQAFDIQAIDYIQKPMDMSKLMRAVERVLLHKEQKNQVFVPEYSDINLPVKVNQKHFFVRANNAYIRINYDDLLYLEANENYTKFVTTKDKHMVLVPFQTSLAQLDNAYFKEINRGKAINLNHIQSVSETHVEVSNGDKLAISFSHKNDLKNIISENLITR